MKRRNFLLGNGLRDSPLSPTASHVFARALAQSPLSGTARRRQTACLVLLNLAGGNDGLNCVVPHGNDRYYQLRPALAIDRHEVLAIDRNVGFNPGMRSHQGALR